MSTYVLDTHALAWYLDGDPKLSKAAESVIDSPDSRLIIPTIILAELKYLFSRKRIAFPIDDVFSFIGNDNRCLVYPFDLNCVEFLDERLNLHDAIIVSTALVFRSSFDEETFLVTKDSEIHKLNIIKVIW